MNVEEIKKIIPHRPPFLFVEEVVEITDRKIIARRTVRADEYFFSGHFPQEPIMPGVIIVEAIAQTGAILMLRKYDKALPLFLGIDRARFRKIVRPGDVLEMAVEILQERSGVAKISGTARVGGDTVCEATLTAGIKK